jgi:hypothetical protein
MLVGMHIDAYEFGRIVIDGREYSEDVILFPDRVQAHWWRREGHYLHIEDLAAVLEAPPAILIIGHGFAGAMWVPDRVVGLLEAEGMAVHVARSREAVRLYNELAPDTPGLVAAIHLTC